MLEKFIYTVTGCQTPQAPVKGTLVDLVLDAYLIPRCGLIPPFAALREQLRTGGGDGGMSPGCIWEPIDPIEPDYLDMVSKLEALTPEDLSLRHRNPQIVGEIRSDYAGTNAKSWREWQDSLAHRGLLPY
jgi:hypothetical protein